MTAATPGQGSSRPLGGVFVSIVSYNSAAYLRGCIDSLLNQTGFAVGKNLFVQVTDNASSDTSVELVRDAYSGCVKLVQNSANLGFCGGHNQGAQAFLESPAHFLLILNPDVKLQPDMLQILAGALEKDPRAGAACPRLMRCNESLEPLVPPQFDSTGMFMTPSLRHFDRGSGELDQGQYRTREYVFGGTGACLLLKRECVLDLLVDLDAPGSEVLRVYPQLADFRDSRAQLFDEAFFAYREDADLAWRAQLFGWNCLYEPAAVALHKRVVVPERRRSLPPELNRLSVRNRFLLQLNNASLSLGLRPLLEGLLVRNLLVVLGVMATERSSLSAFREALLLRKRAWSRRRHIFGKAVARGWAARDIGRWFKSTPYVEKAQ